MHLFITAFLNVCTGYACKSPKNCFSLYLNCLCTLIVTYLHLHAWQLAAGVCCERQSLCLWRELIRCADVCPILFSAYSVNTICAFHFSRLLFDSTPSASPPPMSTPARLSLFPPLPPSLLALYPLILGHCKSRAFCCKGWYFWSQVTHTFMFQAPMTVTDMYIMLSDSVRHVSSLPLFIWKLFNVSGQCVVETYSGSFLYYDSHFAGADTLLHMNMKHILHLYSRCLAGSHPEWLPKSEQQGGVVSFLL